MPETPNPDTTPKAAPEAIIARGIPAAALPMDGGYVVQVGDVVVKTRALPTPSGLSGRPVLVFKTGVVDDAGNVLDFVVEAAHARVNGVPVCDENGHLIAGWQDRVAAAK